MSVPLSFGSLPPRRSELEGSRQREMGSESTVQVLLAARGALFDGLAALSNLQQLLGSVRVGPRGLQELLPETAGRCQLLALAAGEFCDAARVLAGSRSSLAALDHLADFCRSTLEQVSIELQSATRDLRANPRLELEARLGRRTESLGAAFGLVDLIADALVQKRATVELLELLRQASASDDLKRRGTAICSLAVTIPAPPIALHTSARVAVELMVLAAGWLYRRSTTNLALVVEACTPERPTVLRFSSNKPLCSHPALQVVIRRTPWVRITPLCARLAAELSGAEMLDSDEASALTLRWPSTGSY